MCNITTVLLNCKTILFIISQQAHSFMDLRPGGGLCHILGTAYKFKVEQGWWVPSILHLSCFVTQNPYHFFFFVLILFNSFLFRPFLHTQAKI